jgi:signal transduction histidine kinase
MPEHVPDAQAEELRQMIIRLARLVEVSVTLNSTLDIRRLLQFIIDTAADLVDSEAASIMLVDENTHDLRFAAATGSDPDELAPIPVPLEGSIAGTIVREDRGLIINQVTGDPRHFGQVGERVRFQTRSLIGVPMRIRDRVTGVLEAVNKRGGDFSENDLQTLSIIASQAAVALHNARLVEALQRAYDELDKLDRMKRDFISIASHELRTPLGLILGYATILREEADPAASVHAEAVLNSALRMRALIEDMTNMNLMQAGSADVSLARHPLQPVIQAAQQEVAELVRAKGQRLTVRMPQEALLAMIDPPKLGRAVANLLNNAMRFTPAEGSLRLELERRAAEAWLRVADDGAGIPPDQLEAIFERFYQVEDHMTRRHGGMGLGLAIVRAIVRAHGGRVWAESEGLGRGATFTIALPLQPDPAPAAAGAASG